jgi:hypothetical protein
MLVPPYTYLKSDQFEDIINGLKKWEENIERKEFKHIFYITSEIDWKNFEDELKGSLIWLPSLPLEHLNESQKIPMIESQVKQLQTLFTQKWHENL